MTTELTWRTMRSAPKDRIILLAVAHSGGDDQFVVNFGRWVDVPYTAELIKSWTAGGTTDARKIPAKGRWLASHVAIMDHAAACTGHTVEGKIYLVFPKYWAELPQTPLFKK